MRSMRSEGYAYDQRLPARQNIFLEQISTDVCKAIFLEWHAQ